MSIKTAKLVKWSHRHRVVVSSGYYENITLLLYMNVLLCTFIHQLLYLEKGSIHIHRKPILEC